METAPLFLDLGKPKPTLRQIEWRFVLVLSRTLIQTRKICERRNLFSVFFISAHPAIGQTQCECRIRIIGRAFNGEPGPGDLGVGLLLDLLLGLVNFAQIARRRVDQAGEIEHLGIFTDTCDPASVEARARYWAEKAAKMPASGSSIQNDRSKPLPSSAIV